MKKYEAYFKIKPIIRIEGVEELEEAITNMMVDITMNVHDFIGFEEVIKDCEHSWTDLNNDGKEVCRFCNKIKSSHIQGRVTGLKKEESA